VETVIFEHKRSNMNMPNTPEAYSVLLEEAIKGDQSFFIRKDEIEYSWKVVDSIMKNKLQVYPYKVGSNGPKELEDWNKKNNLFWKQ
jgi:glucose-6-phosphate 1-dehydrogenase